MKQLERKQMNAVKAGAVKKTTVTVGLSAAGTNATITPVVAPIEDGASCNVITTVLPLFL